MKAIVLAAGLGNRLGPLTEDRPKAMVQVDGRELILRVMDFLDGGDFSERVVITGFRSELLSNFLSQRCPDVKVLVNPDYKVGSIKTIETALPHLDDEFLLMNVDHVYPKRMMARIMENKKGITAICDFDRDLGDDDMKVKLNDERQITSISKKLTDYDGGYIGMTWCSRDGLSTYRRAITKALEKHGDSANVEAILGLIAEEKQVVDTCDASGIGWLEIDTQDDLQSATKALQRDMDFLT